MPGSLRTFVGVVPRRSAVPARRQRRTNGDDALPTIETPRKSTLRSRGGLMADQTKTSSTYDRMLSGPGNFAQGNGRSFDRCRTDVLSSAVVSADPERSWLRRQRASRGSSGQTSPACSDPRAPIYKARKRIGAATRPCWSRDGPECGGARLSKIRPSGRRRRRPRRGRARARGRGDGGPCRAASRSSDPRRYRRTAGR